MTTVAAGITASLDGYITGPTRAITELFVATKR